MTKTILLMLAWWPLTGLAQDKADLLFETVAQRKPSWPWI